MMGSSLYTVPAYVSSSVRVGAEKTYAPLMATPIVILTKDQERYMFGILEPILDSLTRDVRAKTIYRSPSKLDEVAEAAEAAAKAGNEFGDVGDCGMFVPNVSCAAIRREEASILRQRIKDRKLGDAQVAREIALAREIRGSAGTGGLQERWISFKKEQESFIGVRWSVLQAFDIDLQKMRDRFVADTGGLALSIKSLPTPVTPGGAPIPWAWILVLISLGVGAYFLSQITVFIPKPRPI